MVFGVFRLRTRKDNERGSAVASTALLVFLMLMFAEGSTGGGGKNGYSGGSFWSAAGGPSNFGLAIAVTAMAGLAVAATVVYSRRGKLKSPWSRRRRKQALCLKQWNSFFTADGRFDDDGVKFLKKVRSGGVDPSIRAEVWPFLLGVYELNSSKEERDSIRERKRKEYVNLRKQYCQIYRSTEKSSGSNERAGCGEIGDREEFSQVLDSRELKEVNSSRRSPFPDGQEFDQPTSDSQLDGDCNQSVITSEDASDEETESTVSRASEENEILSLPSAAEVDATNSDECGNDNSPPSSAKRKAKSHTDEDLATWQRIIRLDAVRANDEWVIYSPCQASVSEAKARQLATRVHLKDYEHLEPCRVFHAARLVAILEAYAVYDPEIGYCQGMSDLLSPIISVLEEDHLAFWCFVGFMRKARHNFRLDEVGIRRQLGMVSKIIKCKDIHLFRHLEKLQAEDCFFVYRMVVVLFRRELTFEQTLCLWEVMWADQAVIRAGIAKSTWGRIRLRTPPTEDLLLYAIAACVLQKRKTIIEKYSSMDEIMRECNSMAGHLDVWKLLDDAHDLVINLHDKV